MKLGGILLIGYVLLGLLMLGVYRANQPVRYSAARSLAANHRVAKGDFSPDPEFGDGPRYLGSAVRVGERITEKDLLTLPIAWPMRNRLLVAFDAAILPTGTDVGDTVSLCAANGGELAVATVAAVDCGNPNKKSVCRVAVEGDRDVSPKLLSPDALQGLTSFSAQGSCKAAPAPAKRRPKRHRTRRHKVSSRGQAGSR